MPTADSAPTAIPISAPVARQLDKSLKPLVGTDVGNASVLAVAIVQNGAIAYARSFGTANDQTRFRIASLTKMMTAVYVLQLLEHGRIKLDERVSAYLPNAPYADQITVRQLLNHTSGLYNYGDDSFITGADKTPTTPQISWSSSLHIRWNLRRARASRAAIRATSCWDNSRKAGIGEVVCACTDRPGRRAHVWG